MGKQFTLTTADKHSLGAYRADPQGKAKGGMVVVQEIFGVNHHIRAVCDRLAGLGYAAVAPAVFDRFVRDFEMRLYAGRDRACAQLAGQSQLGAHDGRHRRRRCGPEGHRPDRRDRLLHGRHRGVSGGLPACPAFAAAVAYYGGMIGKFADEKPKCPLQMHFGEKDESIPMATVEEIKKKQAQAETYVYPGAAHGFYCDERASYNKAAADLAWSRTQEFLAKHMK